MIALLSITAGLALLTLLVVAARFFPPIADESKSVEDWELPSNPASEQEDRP
jgi:hypothetical protein